MEKGKFMLLKMAIFFIWVITLGLCIFLLPSLAKDAAESNPEYAYLRFPVLIGLYMTAVPYFFALYQALKLLNYIRSNVVFTDLAVISLGSIKKCAITILILYGLGLILLVSQNALHPGVALLAFIIIFITMIILLFTVILQGLLKNILEIKSENDLTI